MEQNKFTKGITDGLPICIGYFAVSFAFGIAAVQSGLTWLEALLISARPTLRRGILCMRCF